MKAGIDPLEVSPSCWVYPQADGLAVVIEKRLSGVPVVTLQELIPWDRVEAALRARPKSKSA